MPFTKGFGLPEIIIILVIILIIFGVGRLPQVGSGLGKAIRNFKKGMAGEEEEKAAQAPEKTSEASDKKGQA